MVYWRLDNELFAKNGRDAESCFKFDNVSRRDRCLIQPKRRTVSKVFEAIDQVKEAAGNNA